MALDRHGQTAAHLACEHRSPTCLRALLDSAAPGTVDLEARNYDGEDGGARAQGGAIRQGLASFCGCRVPSPSLTGPPCVLGLTALHVAVNTECQEAVLLLLEHGADIDAVVSEGAEPEEGGAGVGGACVGGRGSRSPSRLGGGDADQIASCGVRARKDSRPFPPRHRTLRAAAPRSSTPWRTTA